MSESGDKTFTGPFEDTLWPDKLKARVVTPGPRPQIHGYDVEGDLARHYGFAETVLLALTGDLPDEKAARAFEVALVFAAPISIAEAPAHAAGLARMCGAGASGIIGVGTIALSEQARYILSEYSELLEYLDNPDGALPARYKTTCDTERASVSSLRIALSGSGLTVPILEADPCRTAAVIAAFHACGIKRSEQLDVVLVMARIACVFTEALAVVPGSFSDYPMDLPPFRYHE